MSAINNAGLRKSSNGMRKVILIISAAIVFIAVVLLFKDAAIKMSVERGTMMVTGLPLSIRHLNIGLARSVVSIKGLKLFNPKGFKDRAMVDMPEIYVDYDLPAILRGKIHLRQMRLNLKEFVVVKDEDGRLNLDSLKVVKAEKAGRSVAGGAFASAPEIAIDDLHLMIGKAVYKDYSLGAPPRVKEFNVDINERYKDITDPYELVSLIVVRALTDTTISNLTDFDIKGLRRTVSDTLSRATGVASKAASIVQEAAKKTVTEVEKAAESIEDIFKLPFGSGGK